MNRPIWPNWNETIAIFGGRFDPPHVGHFEAIRGLFNQPGVQQVWVLPSPTPAHKAAVASLDHRVAMARMGLLDANLVGGKGEVKLDLREIERAQRQPGAPTYTFDTLQELRRDIPHLAFVIGTDQLEKFPTWYRYQETLKLSHWIVLDRKSANPGSNTQLDRGYEILKEWEASGLAQKTAQTGLWALTGGKTFLTVVPTEAPFQSSTVIRESIARTGEADENSLRPGVLAYLKQNHLYGIRTDFQQIESSRAKP